MLHNCENIVGRAVLGGIFPLRRPRLACSNNFLDSRLWITIDRRLQFGFWQGARQRALNVPGTNMRCRSLWREGRPERRVRCLPIK